MRSSSEIFADYLEIRKLSLEEKRSVVARLIAELQIEPSEIYNTSDAMGRIPIAIKLLTSREKGIQPGVQVKVSGKKGLFTVSGHDSFGNVKFEGTKMRASPTQVHVQGGVSG